MAEGGPSPPDLETQKNEILNLTKKTMKNGDVWYLLDNRWFKQWKKYVGCDTWDSTGMGEQSAHPGPIDNRSLFKEDGSNELREHLIDEVDYTLVPQEAWELLVSWYSLVDCQQPIARNVVEYGMFVKHCKVEVYLMEFKLCQNNDLDNCITRKFSKADTIEFIEKEMRRIFNIPENKETRLWNRYTSSTYEHLSKKDSTVQDAGLYQGQMLVIEQKNDDDTWPRQVKCCLDYASTSSDARFGNSSSSISTRFGSMGGYGGGYGSYNYNEGGVGSVQPGLCGLSNLGNTCFMNSAIQCMSNCPTLTHYFLDDKYWSELNTENPLGMRGEIAKAFGELIKVMWSGRYTYTVPRNFKMQVGRFAPQFSGYQQQDSQELMAFLLDGLHEDLNRIKKKPYIEQKEADNRADAEVAQEAWDNYRKRNDSIIVDIFHGLLKSTLVCPECAKISVTFDPFCYLTLPMPIKKERHIDIFFISLDPMKKYIQYKLTVPKMGNIADLCQALSKLTDIPPNQMIVADVYNHKFHKIFQLDEGLNNILERDDIFIYQIPVSSCDDPDVFVLPVYMREKKLRPGCNNYANASWQLFGQPMLVPVPRKDTTYDRLYKLILERLQRFVRIPDPKEQWWINSTETMNGEVEMTNGDDEYESDTQNEDEDSPKPDGFSMSNNHEEQNHTNNSNQGHMFTMHFVNSYGNTEVNKLKDDGRPIKFDSRIYMAIDWNPLAKEKFYDEKAAEQYEQHESVGYRPSAKKQVIQLGECLELFTAVEKLSAEDSWYCPVCKEHQQATKKFDLWMLPKILILCFKRFSYNRYWRDKIDTLVEFPIKSLNMAKYIINKCHDPAVYDLIAVSNHYGGMGGGHYTAYAKNKDDHQWYYFDDNNVSLSGEDSVVSKAAYVLFYMRRDPSTPLTPPPIQRDIPATVGTSSLDDGQMILDDDLKMEIN